LAMELQCSPNAELSALHTYAKSERKRAHVSSAHTHTPAPCADV
jgi:hypothetical protein